MSKYAIEIENLGKMYKLYKKSSDKILDVFGLNFWKKDYYKEFWALRNLNLKIEKGERIGIIGRNGAGKSTLLKTVIGNISPTEGLVNVEGDIQALMELGTGFHPEFTGRENIRASLAYKGLTKTEINEKEESIIDFAELEDFIDQPIKTYSAGMYARLAFSTATSIDPDILIIDEVLGAGDAYFAGKCVERMKKITHNSGATVLFVSHDLNSVLQLCDRVIWIDRGKVRKEGNPLEVIKEYSAMVRKEEEYRLRARDLKISKKKAMMIDNREDIYESILFHFVGEKGESPEGENRIYNIRLFNDKSEIENIDVGGPMDNSVEHQNYIIDEKGYMDWSEPYSNENTSYRSFTNLDGKYKHAPFQFSIPKHLLREELYIEVEARLENKVKLEIYNGEGYKKIGTLDPNQKSNYRFMLSLEELVKKQSDNEVDKEKIDTSDLDNTEKNIDKLNKINENNLDDTKETEDLIAISQDKNIDEYGTKEAKITSVRMLNHLGNDAKVFETNKPLKVVIDFKSKYKLDRPVFVFCVYMPDGRCASQWIADENIYQETNMPLKGSFKFTINELLLGQGSYIASVAIFKTLPNGKLEPESYHVLDKCVHFEIKQPIGELIDKGICIQPFEGMITNG